MGGAKLTGIHVLSFLNCTKYPPSLLFLLMTLGPALLVTGWIDRIRFSADNPLIVFGRVPLFYFILHFWSIHLIAAVFLWLRQAMRACSGMVRRPWAASSKITATTSGWSMPSGFRWSRCFIRSAAGSRGSKSGARTGG